MAYKPQDDDYANIAQHGRWYFQMIGNDGPLVFRNPIGYQIQLKFVENWQISDFTTTTIARRGVSTEEISFFDESQDRNERGMIHPSTEKLFILIFASSRPNSAEDKRGEENGRE